MSNFHDTTWAEQTIATARRKTDGKPLENNTRLYENEDGSFRIRLHNTDIITINTDGTYTLAAGGYHTVTTMDRMSTYAPVRSTLFSEKGEWFVRIEPSDTDPRPNYIKRTVPKPFTATDPGDEPVKSELGCQAGTMIGTDHVDEIVEIYRQEMIDGDEEVELVSESRIGVKNGADRYDRIKVKRSWTSWIYYGEAAYSYSDREFSAAKIANTHVTYEQCPHCKAFNSEHERWRVRMHGHYGERFDAQTGYKTYREMMDTYGTQESWQEAYIADFRKRRAYLKADKEWDQRNRVAFYDGLTVDSDGYAPRLRKNGPSPAKLRRHEAQVKKMKARIAKYIDGYIGELVKGTLPMPGGGDCWYCALSQDGGRTPMGDNMPTLYPDGTVRNQPSHGHLDEHMKDRYYVPTLAVNALRETGLSDTGVYLWLDMNPDTGKMGGRDTGRNPYGTVRRALKKYMEKRLVPTTPTN